MRNRPHGARHRLNSKIDINLLLPLVFETACPKAKRHPKVPKLLDIAGGR